MKLFQNGDRCPCCGEILTDKSAEWLEVFSQLCHAADLDELETPGLKPMDTPSLRPPDAGIYPPVNPTI